MGIDNRTNISHRTRYRRCCIRIPWYSHSQTNSFSFSTFLPRNSSSKRANNRPGFFRNISVLRKLRRDTWKRIGSGRSCCFSSRSMFQSWRSRSEARAKRTEQPSECGQRRISRDSAHREFSAEYFIVIVARFNVTATLRSGLAALSLDRRKVLRSIQFNRRDWTSEAEWQEVLLLSDWIFLWICNLLAWNDESGSSC